MRKYLFPLLTLLFVLFTFNSCIFKKCSGNSGGPTVTLEIPVEEDAYGQEHVSFKGKTPSHYLVFDHNKRCPYNRDQPFRTYKPYKGAPILTGDHCAKCGYTWSLHKDK